MKKFMRTLWLFTGMLFSTVNTLPSSTDGTLYDIIQSETPETLYLMKEFNVSILEREKITNYPIISPINPQDVTRISSFYGERIHPIYKSKQIHKGIDIAALKGTPVLATGAGIISGTKRIGGYGKQVTIDHGNDYTSRYAHLSKILVAKGDKVNLGDTIGEVGSTGLSTGNHLHYEISHQFKHVDPLFMMPDTLQSNAYLDYLQAINDRYTSCSDIFLTFKINQGEENTEPTTIN